MPVHVRLFWSHIPDFPSHLPLYDYRFKYSAFALFDARLWTKRPISHLVCASSSLLAIVDYYCVSYRTP